MDNTQEKACNRCGKIKSLDDFYTQNKYSKKLGNYTYYNPECKECTAEKSMEWRNINPEKRKTSTNKYNKHDYIIKRKREAAKKRRLEGKHKEWQQNNKDKIKIYNKNRVMNKKHEMTETEWDNCKNYFNNSCAYCGITEEETIKKYDNVLHKEHVDHEGLNDISNNIPACKGCNSKKYISLFDEWYNDENKVFSKERYNKIIDWLNGGYLKYKETKIKLVF
jgi:hypothetical protein